MRRISPTLILAALTAAACGDGPSAPLADGLEMIYWSGDTQVQSCYVELPDPVVVRVLDPDELPVVGQAVEFRVMDGGGWVREDTATSDSAGFATGYWTVGAPGPQVLEARATSPGGTSQFARFTATAEPADVGERRIAMIGFPNPLTPDVSGDRIVWEDYRNGHWDIYLYDLATEMERRITSSAAAPYTPAISRARIVWMDYRNGNGDIYLYDLATEMERAITTDTSRQDQPAIDGDRIVWYDVRNGGLDIYLYDLVTQEEYRVTTDGARPQTYLQSPRISGDRIVWQDLRNEPWEVYLYDLATETEQRIAVGSSPAIWGDRVVYSRYNGQDGYSDIYLYDLGTETERRITTDASDPWWPAIAGNRIVWIDERSGKLDLYLYDLATGTERRLATELNSALVPSHLAISETRIVWTDDRIRWTGEQSWSTELYLYDLASACVPPAAAGVLRSNVGGARVKTPF